jgi:hypothetical protein
VFDQIVAFSSRVNRMGNQHLGQATTSF